jgi:antirestriction protein ArdC
VTATPRRRQPRRGFFATQGITRRWLRELTHWARHASRLAREFGRKRWGDAGYAADELIAELGSAFLCADLGVTAEPRDDHSSYLASWLDVVKNDNLAIFIASASAQRAADYLHALQQRQEEIGAAA